MFFRIKLALAIVAALGLMLAAPLAASAQTVNDNTGSTSGSQVNDFGPAASRTYGQTIQVPTNGDTELTHFAFMMRDAETVIFRAKVYAWDATTFGLTGPALYTSAPTTIAATAVSADANGYKKIEFATGGIALTAGAMYVIFTTVLDDSQPSISPGIQWGYPADDSNSQTEFVHCDQFTEADLVSTPCSAYQGVDTTYLTIFEKPIVLTALTPASGPVAGGTTVIISGTGFAGTRQVDFGSVAATSFTIDSDTQITAIAPALPAGTAAVMMVGDGYSSQATSAAAFTSVAPAAAVVSSPSLAATGTTTETSPLGLTGSVLLFVGALALALSRKHRRSQSGQLQP